MDIPPAIYSFRLNQHNISSVVKILVKDPYVTRNWEQLANGLGIPDINLIKRILNLEQEFYSVFMRLLGDWIGRTEPRNATMGKFLDILLDCEFKNVREQLIQHFKSTTDVNNYASYSSKTEIIEEITMDLFNIRAYFNSRVRALILHCFYKHFKPKLYEIHDSYVKGLITTYSIPTEYVELHLDETEQKELREEIKMQGYKIENKDFIDKMYSASICTFGEPTELENMEDVLHFVNFLKHAQNEEKYFSKFIVLRNLVVGRIVHVKCKGNLYDKSEVDQIREGAYKEVNLSLKS